MFPFGTPGKPQPAAGGMAALQRASAKPAFAPPSYGGGSDANELPPRRGGAEAAAKDKGGKKRRRDISSLKVFKEHMYGEGIRRLHAMVEQNPILMYPPPGIDEAREHARIMNLLETPQHPAAAAVPTPPTRGIGDFDTFLQELEGAEKTPEGAVAGPNEPAEAHAVDPFSDAYDAATYHHRQLASLVSLFYEFNHTEFVKMPMQQTLDLLMRCGREAYAHVHEFEQEERNRKRRILEERAAVQKQYAFVETQKQAGREAYLESQLEEAEARARTIASLGTLEPMDESTAPPNTVVNDGEADEEMEDWMMDVAPAGAADPATMYTMFPDVMDEPAADTEVPADTAPATAALTETLIVVDTANISTLEGVGQESTPLHAE